MKIAPVIQANIHAAKGIWSTDGRLAIPGAVVDDACPADELAGVTPVEFPVVDVPDEAPDIGPPGFMDVRMDGLGVVIGPPGFVEGTVDMLVVMIGPPGLTEVCCDDGYEGRAWLVVSAHPGSPNTNVHATPEGQHPIPPGQAVWPGSGQRWNTCRAHKSPVMTGAAG